jgi:catechol-2,3-dioxygenase
VPGGPGAPIAIGIPTRADLEQWRDELAALGEQHEGIIAGHAGSVLVGLHDPDGIEIRMYTLDSARRPSIRTATC